MKFSDDLPEKCPPDDAMDASGIVYRIVKNDPPTAFDMQTHHESGRLLTADPCLRCGLSVFREQSDAIHQRHLIPKLGKWIAKAQLTKELGMTKLTKGKEPTHTTWWVYDGVVRESYFEIVQEQE